MRPTEDHRTLNLQNPSGMSEGDPRACIAGGARAVAALEATSACDKGKWSTGSLGQGSDGEHPTLTTFDWEHPLFGLSPITSH